MRTRSLDMDTKWHDILHMTIHVHLGTAHCIWLLLASWDYSWTSFPIFIAKEMWWGRSPGSVCWTLRCIRVNSSLSLWDQNYGWFKSSWPVLAHNPARANVSVCVNFDQKMADVCWYEYWDLGTTLRNRTRLSGIPRNGTDIAGFTTERHARTQVIK